MRSLPCRAAATAAATALLPPRCHRCDVRRRRALHCRHRSTAAKLPPTSRCSAAATASLPPTSRFRAAATAAAAALLPPRCRRCAVRRRQAAADLLLSCCRHHRCRHHRAVFHWLVVALLSAVLYLVVCFVSSEKQGGVLFEVIWCVPFPDAFEARAIGWDV